MGRDNAARFQKSSLLFPCIRETAPVSFRLELFLPEELPRLAKASFGRFRLKYSWQQRVAFRTNKGVTKNPCSPQSKPYTIVALMSTVLVYRISPARRLTASGRRARAPVPTGFRARSSAGEHSLHTGGVTGSIPVAPTTIRPSSHPWHTESSSNSGRVGTPRDLGG
jgi:hypothetical protein